ncbi:MAG: hypothetical protein KIT25_06345 [Enhydrobacter sp.]|nr:MAG: hypothetical protein KIT25_06345 [Enhydrobacter sp.]
MTTLTDICNAALSHCGTRSKIESLDEESAEAGACLTHLAFVRDAGLRAFDWNFARLTAALEPLAGPPARWAWKYALPSDCLHLRRLTEGGWELAADRESGGAAIAVVLSDASPASAIYTARIEDPALWDPGFVDAVAYGLASRICYELTGREDRMRALHQLWQAGLQQAAAQAANEASRPGATR